jgi:hypothetical protein
MGIIAKKPESKFTPAPEGIHVAACCDVVDLGLQKTKFGDKHKIEIRWMLEDESEDGERFTVSQRYTNSLSDKATLRKVLETWRGKPFTAEEESAGFDVERVLGAGCQIQVTHSPREKGGVWANVSAVIPLGRGQKNPGVDPAYVRQKDRPTSNEREPGDESEQGGGF